MNSNAQTDIKEIITNQAILAKKASQNLATLSSLEKNKALLTMAHALEIKTPIILEENNIDMENGRQKGLSASLLDRLLLTTERIAQMAEGLRQIANLNDPIGNGIMSHRRPNGLDIRCIRVPLGLVGIVYEARPNVTADAIGLCLKSGNAVILRGGSEAIHSNKILASILAEAAYSAGISHGAIQFVSITEHSAVDVMMRLNKYIDVIIPRGGAGLIKRVVENSTVPVIETGIGICHVFVDEFADLNLATKIILNAKTSRPAVCNAIETVLIDQKIATEYLPTLCNKLTEAKVEIRGCEKCLAICPELKAATKEDWSTEYGDLIISIKIVENIDEAISHINTYGSGHSEAIITTNYNNALKFQKLVDAAAVYVNASTRFTDGNEFGFGAEIGISTQKLHARGPMGLEALTTMKYLIYGEGQIR
ncbi:glutamate-5-semialdehyde dehydrogenase [uncultured Megamonas sp.]|uniref:glutamate-5-semialdehyde dehydrogenase n=1 Tax=uncultured Megamonas sp. TaxID=286140 RepID=UPI00266EAE00|nr:glutamate-5-semialdehyde dehydrogenase [uncultured Megamonas sp.]